MYAQELRLEWTPKLRQANKAQDGYLHDSKHHKM